MTTDLHQRTRPWQPDELVHVGRLRCCYAFHNSVLLVRLPGGRTATVAQLRQLGHTVTLPVRLRRGANS